jgi:nucleotide-binding universal stress UspA family protein
VRRSPATAGTATHAVLLASEGRPFAPEAIRRAAELARRHGGQVRVLSVARIWGTALGFPHPGLRPSRRELDRHRDDVAHAIRALRRAGVPADGHIIQTRKATRSILGEAARTGCREIVMGGDPPRNAVVGDFMWSQEPQRVKRRARVPVHVVAGAAAIGTTSGRATTTTNSAVAARSTSRAGAS